MLLPPSLDELIGANHPVRVVDDVLSKIDIRPLIGQYKTGGASNYHPCMLLKVLVYAYINNIYSSRRIEEALQQQLGRQPARAPGLPAALSGRPPRKSRRRHQRPQRSRRMLSA